MSDWQPIETAPQDGEEIVLLGTLPDDHRVRACVGRWHLLPDAPGYFIGWQFSAPGYVNRFEPTHWMPLPDPPVGAFKE